MSATFNAAAVVTLAMGSKVQRETYDNVVAPMLTDEQREEVTALIAEQAAVKGRAALLKQVPTLAATPDDDDVTHVWDLLQEVAAAVSAHAPLKDSGTDGGWRGHSVRSIPTPYGSLKVTLTRS